MKKVITLFLTLSLLSGMLLACAKKNDSGTSSTAAPGGSEPTESVTEGAGTTRDPYDDDVPDDLKFDGYKFTMAFPQPEDAGMDYYIIEEGNAISAIDTAVYNRNAQIEERFGITLDGITCGFSDTMVPELITAIMAEEDAVDIALIPFTFSGIPWMTSGYAMPWNDVEYIDLSRSYWSQSMTENISVKGLSFLIQGKINWTSAMSTQVCFFNVNVANDNKIPDLYETVNNYQWTFDKLKTYAKSVARDLDNNGTYDEEDFYGIIQSFYGGMYNWSIASDYTTVLSTEDGLVLNYKTDKFTSIVENVYDLLYNDHTAYVERFDYPADSKGIKIFFQDHALFMFTDLGHGDTFRNEASEYGIIPTPMYDEKQGKYCTTNDQWGLSCGIPTTATNTARTGAIVEAMCALSGKMVYPVYYDDVLSVRNTRDLESREMLDLIFSNIVYDVGITLAVHDTYIPLCKLLDEKNPSKNVASWVDRYSGKIQTQFDDLYNYVALNYGTEQR